MDVIGIGALNLDYLVPRESMSVRLRQQFNDLLGHNLEKFVEDGS